MSLSNPIGSAFTIAPSDSTAFSATSCLYVGTTGNITVTMLSGRKQLFSNVPVGWHPIRCTQVLATGTTASDIVGGMIGP